MLNPKPDYRGLYPLDRHMLRSSPVSALQPRWEPSDGPLPALYLGHGAPPTLDDEKWSTELFEWAQRMPKPRGIVIISAHWEDAPATISAPGIQRELVYDFGGFQQRYYNLEYNTPDASWLSMRMKKEFSNETLDEHPSRGLDHGAWVPLMLMYPLNDVPVIQLSMPTHNAARLLALGKKLASLRSEGILIIGSGFITHGLQYLSGDYFRGNISGGPSWSVDFDLWAADAIGRGDVDKLSAFAEKAPGMPYAHPTVEHYTPLFITMGSANNVESATMEIEGFSYGLSKRSFSVQ